MTAAVVVNSAVVIVASLVVKVDALKTRTHTLDLTLQWAGIYLTFFLNLKNNCWLPYSRNLP